MMARLVLALALVTIPAADGTVPPRAHSPTVLTEAGRAL
jgi:hypothetical protein